MKGIFPILFFDMGKALVQRQLINAAESLSIIFRIAIPLFFRLLQFPLFFQLTMAKVAFEPTFPHLPRPDQPNAGKRPTGAAAELRAEGPSVPAACSPGAGGRTRGGLRRGPVQPGACARLNDLGQRGLQAIRWADLLSADFPWPLS